ncbi:MAG: GGDEF domain-containing protein [Actinomycetia bacterium]|nr:GGDEF domain-containing protein [Actinomycetes bacterium]
MDSALSDEVVKQQTYRIFQSACQLYGKVFACNKDGLDDGLVAAAFERIHAIALEENGAFAAYRFHEFPLTRILVAYVRAMLIERFPSAAECEDHDTYYPEAEKLIWIFMYMYIRVCNPEATKLLRHELSVEPAELFVPRLLDFKGMPYLFSYMNVNTIIDNLRLYNRLFQAIMLEDLYNRFALEKIWDYKKAEQSSQSLGIIMADADKFKEVNDVCGHDEGDNVLKIYGESLIMARSAMADCKGRILVSRWGGEEFVVCLYGCSEGEVIEYSQRFKSQLAEHTGWGELVKKYNSASIVFPRTVSQGIIFKKSSISGKLAELVDEADQQMYCAKKEGGRNCTYYEGKKL